MCYREGKGCSEIPAGLMARGWRRYIRALCLEIAVYNVLEHSCIDSNLNELLAI